MNKREIGQILEFIVIIGTAIMLFQFFFSHFYSEIPFAPLAIGASIFMTLFIISFPLSIWVVLTFHSNHTEAKE